MFSQPTIKEMASGRPYTADSCVAQAGFLHTKHFVSSLLLLQNVMPHYMWQNFNKVLGRRKFVSLITHVCQKVVKQNFVHVFKFSDQEA